MRLGYETKDDAVTLGRELVRDGFARAPAGLLAEQLLELGWGDLLMDDPATAIRAVFEEQGASLGRSDALQLLAAWALGEPVEAGGVALAVEQYRPEGSGGEHWVALTPGAALAGSVVMLGDSRAEVRDSADVSFAVLECLDPSMTTWSVRRPERATAMRATDSSFGPVRVAFSLAVSLELIGAARHLLGGVCEHAKTRTQFGVPIGTFQAVQMLLADAAVDLAGASDVATTMLEEIGSVADLHSQTGHEVGAILASRAAAHVAASAQQVFGAISYTREHEFGRYFRRISVLNEIVGAGRLSSGVCDRILASGELPAIGPYRPRESAGHEPPPAPSN